MRVQSVLGLALVVALGCGGPKFAPVSGKVTLNGKPMGGATVSFLPRAPKGSLEAGPSSVGKTNGQGEYTLEAASGDKGALVGTHRVSVSLIDPEVGDRDTPRPKKTYQVLTDKFPPRYNEKTELTFDVPSGGTEKADFDLKSP